MDLKEVVERAPILVEGFQHAAGRSHEVQPALLRDDAAELPLLVFLEAVEHDIEVVYEQEDAPAEPVGFFQEELKRGGGAVGAGGWHAFHPGVQSLRGGAVAGAVQ